MNQTQKRLSIIKLAISITDIETIQLQVLKLSPIKTDNKIQEILTLLQSGSYAQAQGLITTYIDSAPDAILQRTSQVMKPVVTEEEQSIIDEFKLFVTPSNHDSKTAEVDINEYPSIDVKITKAKHTVDYNALLNLGADDVLQDNIDIDISHGKEKSQIADKFFEETAVSEVPLLKETDIQKDTFFEDFAEDPIDTPHEDPLELEEEPSTEEELTDSDNAPVSKEPIAISYKAMPHITQKFITMKKRYPLIQTDYETFDTLDSLLNKITQEGYTENEIEEMIGYIQKLVEKTEYTQAAQLLLVCAATESKYAQFMLARELYKGKVLEKNIIEAFTLMNTLALDDNPEALCDLGQFYENGIGTSPDLMKAEGLYKEALDLGIKRAKKHHARLKKHNRGFLKR